MTTLRGEERKHPVRDRDEDRQQQAEGAELDRDEHQPRVVNVQVRGVQREADEADAERDGARERRARSCRASRHSEPRQEGEPEQPSPRS